MTRTKKVLTGSAVFVAITFLKRLIGLVSTLILARVLVPEDFGIVAIATIVLNFCQVMSATGSDIYIVQLEKEKLTKKVIDTGWTVNLMTKVIIFTLLVGLTPMIADWYDDQRLVEVLYAISAILLLNAIRTSAGTLLRKEHRYSGIFKVEVTDKFISVLVAVTIAVVYQTYWALIIGQLVSHTVNTIGSYFIHSYRPSLSLSNIKVQLKFTGWVVPREMFGYFRSQIDTFLVSSQFGKTELGNYHVMKYISFMPSSQIIEPVTQPLMAEFSHSKGDKQKLAYQFNLSFLCVALIAIPVASYFMYFRELTVHILLGQKWLPYADIFGALSVLIASHMFHAQNMSLLNAVGKVKLTFYYEIVTNAILATALLTLSNVDLLTFSLARSLIELTFAFLLFIYVSKPVLQNSVTKSLLRLIAICLASLLSLLLADLLYQPIWPLFANFVAVSVTFGLSYLTIVIAYIKLAKNKSQELHHIEFLLNKGLQKVRPNRDAQPSN